MKDFLSKIWVPVLLVALAAMQSFGIDAHRAIRLRNIFSMGSRNAAVKADLLMTEGSFCWNRAVTST